MARFPNQQLKPVLNFPFSDSLSLKYWTFQSAQKDGHRREPFTLNETEP